MSTIDFDLDPAQDESVEPKTNTETVSKREKIANAWKTSKRAALIIGAPLAFVGGSTILNDFQKGNPVEDMSKAAGVENLNTCAITSTDGIELMVGATIDPETGEANAFTYARPGSNSPSKAAFSFDTVQERTDAEGNVVTDEVKGDIIGINPDKKIQNSTIYPDNGSQIKEIKLNAKLINTAENGSRIVTGTCTTAVSRGLGD